MKPFNLEAALKGDPVVTRDGRKIAFIAHDPGAAESFRLLVRAEGARAASLHYENGRLFQDNKCAHDLFMAPKKRTVWVNLYPTPTQGPGWFATERSADVWAGLRVRIGDKAWPVEIEE